MEDFTIQSAYFADVTLEEIEEVLYLLYQMESHYMDKEEGFAKMNQNAMRVVEL